MPVTLWTILLSRQLTAGTAITRLILALLMSGLLGLERTRKLRPAGLRTYMLVCVGACAVMMTGLYVNQNYAPTADPSRMASQVISGIGFIGAGTIMVTGCYRIKGLTTAAGLWATACLGIALGAGFVALALGTFGMLLLIMTSADRLEQAYYSRLNYFSVSIIIQSLETLRAVSQQLREENILLSAVEIGDTPEHVGVSVSGALRGAPGVSHEALLQRIRQMDGVYFAE